MERFTGGLSWRGGRGDLIGGEAYQRAFDIVKQPLPGAHRRTPPGDEYIVMTGPRMKGRQTPRRLAQAPFGPVANHRPADLPSGRKADSHRVRTVVPTPSLGHHRATRTGERLGGRQKIGALSQAFDGLDGFGQSEVALRERRGEREKSGRQALAATGAAAGDDLLAVLGGHARAKAVAALAHQTGRLKGPLHDGLRRKRG